MNKNSESIGYSLRPYQNMGVGLLLEHTKKHIRNIEMLRMQGKYTSAALAEMATGSGKTLMTGKFIGKLFHSLDVSELLREKFKDLHVVILSDLIGGVTQFRDDLIGGRTGKKPVFSEKILKNLKVSTYHSRKDGEDLNSRLESIEVDHDNGTDELICSTWQTALIKNLADKIGYVDIIVIDEAHNVYPDGGFDQVVSALEKKGRDGNKPIILSLTATPSNITKELFGEAVFAFPIGEYLASGYAPTVDYNIVTGLHANNNDVKQLTALIKKAKVESNFDEKNQILSDAQDLLGEIMLVDMDMSTVVADISERAGIKNNDIYMLRETVVFVSSIREADMMASAFDQYSGQSGYALAYHSENDENNALERLNNKNDPCRIVIGVGKLNESIDLPIVQNIIFYRFTKNPRIFLQQFGRGLRGTGIVKYFDYVGGLHNFAWIGQIYEEYRRALPLIDPMSPSSVSLDSEQENIPQITPSLSGGLSVPIQLNTILGSPEAHRANSMNEELKSIPIQVGLIAGDVAHAPIVDKNTQFTITAVKIKQEGIHHAVNLGDIGLYIETTIREQKSSVEISEATIRDFFRNISGAGEPDSYERLHASESFFFLGATLPKLRKLVINGIPVEKIPLIRPHLRKKGDFLRFVIPFFKDLRLEENKRATERENMENEHKLLLNQKKEKLIQEYISEILEDADGDILPYMELSGKSINENKTLLENMRTIDTKVPRSGYISARQYYFFISRLFRYKKLDDYKKVQSVLKQFVLSENGKVEPYTHFMSSYLDFPKGVMLIDIFACVFSQAGISDKDFGLLIDQIRTEENIVSTFIENAPHK